MRLSSLNQRLRGDVSVEIGPRVLREIVQLAAPHRIPVVTPGKHFGIQPLVESGGPAAPAPFFTKKPESPILLGGAALADIVGQNPQAAPVTCMHPRPFCAPPPQPPP